MDNLLEAADPRDYLSYPTFGPLPAAMAADSGCLRCPCCAGTEFRLRLAHQLLICIECGQMQELENNAPVRPIQVEQGYAHTVTLYSDGTVRAVGSNKDGQCDVQHWSNIIAVSAGRYHTVGLRNNGTAVAVGSNRSGQCNIHEWSNLSSIFAGRYYTFARCSDGTIVCTDPKVKELLR